MPLPKSDIPYRIFGHNSKTAHSIVEFSRLARGWHYGKGGPVDRQVCIWALQLLAHADKLGFTKTEAFPGVDGEVMVSIYPQDLVLDFTIEPDGSIVFRYERDNDDVFIGENLTLEAAKRILTALGTVLWNSSGLYTLDTTAMNPAPSRTLHSNAAKAMGGSRLLTKSVPWQQVSPYVVT